MGSNPIIGTIGTTEMPETLGALREVRPRKALAADIRALISLDEGD